MALATTLRLKRRATFSIDKDTGVPKLLQDGARLRIDLVIIASNQSIDRLL